MKDRDRQLPGLNPEIDTIGKLREFFNQSNNVEVEQRKRTNPEWDGVERMMGIFTDDPERFGLDPKLKPKYDELNRGFYGVYVEVLQPQLRNAVVQMNKKGYPTFESGFFGEDNHQAIIGDFRLGQETKNKLKDLGVEAREFEDEYGNACTSVQFGSTLDIDGMRRKWDIIADILPEGKPHKSRHIEEVQRQMVRYFEIGWGKPNRRGKKKD